MWCLLYELGYKKLNIDDKLIIPFSVNPEDTKQIDILAVNEDTILIVECKSSKENKKSPSFKSELEATAHRYEGIIKSLRQIFGEDKKVKYIFATRNLRFAEDSSDLQRVHNIHAYHMNDNAYAYINNLVNKYKAASIYQFMGLLFKGESISNKHVKIPALQGDMGGKKYYMFSIEPTLLLKMGFVLHRTRTNEMEFPTYQRLLVPSRLGKIAKYLNEGGYFPNSIIINFNDDNGIRFEAHSRHNDSKSRSGTVVIPNAYGIAYIIDRQHRVYGYAFSDYSEKNTIPVVAFEGLSSNEQLEIFMDINQNQKAVSPSLRLDLEEDLYWDSARLDSRMKALKSSVVKSLANDNNSPLYNLISVGEDSALLTFKPFINALSKSSLIPRATQKKFNESDTPYSLYNVANHDTSAEMVAARKRVYKLLRMSYEYVYDYHRVLFDDEESLIISNPGRTHLFVL